MDLSWFNWFLLKYTQQALVPDGYQGFVLLVQYQTINRDRVGRGQYITQFEGEIRMSE